MDYNKIYTGSAIDVLRSFPDECVDSCVTSPPYYGLRDYGVDGQIGLEETPEQYIEKLVEVFAEVRRCLKKDGTLWLNIGDSYNGYKGNANQTNFESMYAGHRHQPARKPHHGLEDKSLKQKDLIGIPWMLAFALRADGWYLRQDIIWSKPNPMPESVTDRCTKSHEYIFLLSKSPKYFFDQEAISEPVADSTISRMAQDVESQKGSQIIGGGYKKPMKAKAPRYGGNKYSATPDKFYRTKSGNAYDYRDRRNKRSVWTYSVARCSEAHFATFPKTLIRPCILAGTPMGGVHSRSFLRLWDDWNCRTGGRSKLHRD